MKFTNAIVLWETCVAFTNFPRGINYLLSAMVAGERYTLAFPRNTDSPANTRQLVGIVTSLSCICKDSRADAHRHHFLQKQLAGIRNLDLTDSGRLVLTLRIAAFIGHLFQICLRRQTTMLANVNSVLIGVAEETIADEIGTSMCNQTITFHLSHTQTTITRTTFQRLSR